jgi:hypothetical protein
VVGRGGGLVHAAEGLLEKLCGEERCCCVVAKLHAVVLNGEHCE